MDNVTANKYFEPPSNKYLNKSDNKNNVMKKREWNRKIYRKV